MKKYEELHNKLNNLLGDYNSMKFDNPINKEEFENLTGLKIDSQEWNNTSNRQSNEYNTTDLRLEIKTDENMTIYLTLELDQDDNITHLVDIDWY